MEDRHVNKLLIHIAQKIRYKNPAHFLAYQTGTHSMKKRKSLLIDDPARRDLLTVLIEHPVGLHVISSWFSDGALGKVSAQDLLSKDAIEAENKYYQENWAKALLETSTEPLPRPYAENAARFQRDCREVENLCTALERAAVSRDKDLIKASQDNLSQKLETIPPQKSLLLALAIYLEERQAIGASRKQIKNARESFQSETDEKIGFGAFRQIILRTKMHMPSRIIGGSVERLAATQILPNIANTTQYRSEEDAGCETAIQKRCPG